MFHVYFYNKQGEDLELYDKTYPDTVSLDQVEQIVRSQLRDTNDSSVPFMADILDDDSHVLASLEYDMHNRARNGRLEDFDPQALMDAVKRDLESKWSERQYKEYIYDITVHPEDFFTALNDNTKYYIDIISEDPDGNQLRVTQGKEYSNLLDTEVVKKLNEWKNSILHKRRRVLESWDLSKVEKAFDALSEDEKVCLHNQWCTSKYGPGEDFIIRWLEDIKGTPGYDITDEDIRDNPYFEPDSGHVFTCYDESDIAHECKAALISDIATHHDTFGNDRLVSLLNLKRRMIESKQDRTAIQEDKVQKRTKTKVLESFTGLYQIKGKAIGAANDHGNYDRFIVFNLDTGNPMVNTRLGLTYRNIVFFKTVAEAESFLLRFKRRSHNLQQYNIEWAVVPYNGRTELDEVRPVQTKYGEAYSYYDFEPHDIERIITKKRKAID